MECRTRVRRVSHACRCPTSVRHRDRPSSAVALALYNRHVKLDTSYERSILRYDGARNINSESCGGGAIRPDLGKLWKQYLPPMSDQILGN